MWITNKLESRQTLKEIVGLPFDELEGNGKFAFMSQKTRLRLFTIDNSFLKTPLKSELNISFWVAPAGNNGTSEKVALFLSIECSKRKFVFYFSKPSFISLSRRPSRHFFGNGNRCLQKVMEVSVETYLLNWMVAHFLFAFGRRHRTEEGVTQFYKGRL